jgi:hypothetical protein
MHRTVRWGRSQQQQQAVLEVFHFEVLGVLALSGCGEPFAASVSEFEQLTSLAHYSR